MFKEALYSKYPGVVFSGDPGPNTVIEVSVLIESGASICLCDVQILGSSEIKSSAVIKRGTIQNSEIYGYVSGTETYVDCSKVFAKGEVRGGHIEHSDIIGTVSGGHIEHSEIFGKVSGGHIEDSEIYGTVSGGHIEDSEIYSTISGGHIKKRSEIPPLSDNYLQWWTTTQSRQVTDLDNAPPWKCNQCLRNMTDNLLPFCEHGLAEALPKIRLPDNVTLKIHLRNAAIKWHPDRWPSDLHFQATKVFQCYGATCVLLGLA